MLLTGEILLQSLCRRGIAHVITIEMMMRKLRIDVLKKRQILRRIRRIIVRLNIVQPGLTIRAKIHLSYNAVMQSMRDSIGIVAHRYIGHRSRCPE